MKTIKKIKDNIGKVAGSALLVGATLAGGAAMVSAQDSGSSGDLGDYPAPFVDDDGEVDASVVVGEEATNGDPVSTLDVVAGIEVAGSLGNAAFTETEQSVSVEGTTGWSASNGVALNRENSNLYAYDAANAQISVAEAGDVDALEDVEFDNQNDDTVQAEFEFEASNVPQAFDSSARGLDDPALYADLSDRTRTSVDSTDANHVMNLRAEFNDNAVQFSHDDMDGEEIEMFGQTFTVDAEETRNEDALVLYGDSQTFSVNRGESETVTVEGNDHEFQVENVNSGEATIRVDGSLESVSESDTVRVSGNDVRIRNIYNYEDGDGVVDFGVGSDELILEDGSEVERDGESIRGTHVSLEGGTVDTFDSSGDASADEVDAINVYVGPESRDDEALMPGDSYQDQVFGVAEFHYGGLNADAAENPAETVNVENSRDSSEAIFTTDDGNELDMTYAYQESEGSDPVLAAEEDEDIATWEGQAMDLDDYFTLNVDERADMFQVTDVTESGADSEVEFENVETGSTIELDDTDFESGEGSGVPGWLSDYITGSSGNQLDNSIDATAEFRHNRQDYVAVVTDADEVHVVQDSAEEVVLYPNMYTETDSAIAFTDEVTDLPAVAAGDTNTNVWQSSGTDVQLSSYATPINVTISSSSNNFNDGDEVTLTMYENANYEGTSVEETYTLASGNISGQEFTVDLASAQEGFDHNSIRVSSSADQQITNVQYQAEDGQNSDSFTSFNEQEIAAEYNIRLPSTKSSSDYTASFTSDDSGLQGDRNLQLDVSSAGANTATVSPEVHGDADDTTPSALLVEPEDDADNEHAFSFTPLADDGSSDEDVGSIEAAYTGGQPAEFSSDGSWVNADDDDGDYNLGYTSYGTFTEHDVDSDQQEIELGLVNAQSVSGFALTGEDGEFSTSASGGDESFTTSSPTYQYADGALDTDSSMSDSPDENVVLVGGPAVNTLVADLAEDNETMSRDEYSEGEGLVQMVPGAFGDNDAVIVAGHSGEDTRAAGEFLADYRDNSEDLEGQSQVTVSTETGSVVE